MSSARRCLAVKETNANIAEDNQNHLPPPTGGRLAGLWTINPDWNLLVTGIYQRGDTMGTWETDPFLGDNKVTRFYDEWRDDAWYTTAATLKGDLGFAELADGVLFRPQNRLPVGQHELRAEPIAQRPKYCG